jgi:hypothetical protein
MSDFLRKPVLSRTRMACALAIAMICDGIQLLTGPAGAVVADQFVDVVAMLLVTVTIGFHPLFLPTFLTELVPIIGMIPTWTGCVLFVLSRQWKQQEAAAPKESSSQPPRSDVIDV